MNPILRSGSLLAIAVALAGCVSVPRPAVRQDGTWCFQSAKKVLCTSKPVPSESAESVAKTFQLAPNRHTVWIVRNDWWDAAGRVEVSVGGVIVETLPRSAVRVEVPAGPATVLMMSNPSSSHQQLTLPPSSQSFLLAERKWGFLTDRFALKQIDETTGKSIAARSKLILDIRSGPADQTVKRNP